MTDESASGQMAGWLRNSSFPVGDAILIQQIYAVNKLGDNNQSQAQATITGDKEAKVEGALANVADVTQKLSDSKPSVHGGHESSTVAKIQQNERRAKITHQTNSTRQTQIVPGVFVDKRGDRNKLGFQSAFRKDVPRYVLLNAGEFYKTASSKADSKGKKADTKESKRYFEISKQKSRKRTRDTTDNDDDRLADEPLFRLNAELNRRVAQDFRDVRNWLALFRYQDILLRSPAVFLGQDQVESRTSGSVDGRSSSKWSRKTRLSELAIVERKLTILQRASDAIPTCAVFRVLRAQLARIVDTHQLNDIARAIREYDELCFRLPSSRIAFDAVERFALRAAVSEPSGYAEVGIQKRDHERQNAGRVAPRRTFAKAIRNFARLNSGELRSHSAASDSFEALMTYATRAIVFDVETDRTELALSTLQCMLEFALRMPAGYVGRSLDEQRALFEPFFDSSFPRVGDAAPATPEDTVSNSSKDRAVQHIVGWTAWLARRDKPQEAAINTSLVSAGDLKLQEFAEMEEARQLAAILPTRDAPKDETATQQERQRERHRLRAWRVIETLRTETGLLAYRGDPSACADLDRLVDADDITPLLFRVDFATADHGDLQRRNDMYRFSLVRFLFDALFGLRVHHPSLADPVLADVGKVERARCWLIQFNECCITYLAARECYVQFKRSLLNDVADCFTSAPLRSQLAEAQLRFDMSTFAKRRAHTRVQGSASTGIESDAAFKSEAKRVRTACRNLLKRPENRNSLRMFAGFIQLEALLGNLNDGREILSRMMRFSAEHFTCIDSIVDTVGQLTVTDSNSTTSSLSIVASKLATQPNVDVLFDCIELVRLGVELELDTVTEFDIETWFDLRNAFCAACRDARAARISEPQHRVVDDVRILELFERLFGCEPLETELVDLRIARVRRKFEKVKFVTLVGVLSLLDLSPSLCLQDLRGCMTSLGFVVRLFYAKALFTVSLDRRELGELFEALRQLADGGRRFALRSARAFHFEYFEKTDPETLEVGAHMAAEWLTERLCALLVYSCFARRIDVRLSELCELLRNVSNAFDESLVLAQLTNVVWSHRASLVLASQRFLSADRCFEEGARLERAQSDQQPRTDAAISEMQHVALCEPTGFSQLIALVAVLDFELLLRDRRSSAGVTVDEQAAREGAQNRLENALARFLQRLESAAENCEQLYICPAVLVHFFQSAVDLRLRCTTRLRSLLDRALQNVPWLKALYVIGIQLFPDSAEEIYSMLSDRGLRVRAPVEEVDILLDELAEKQKG